MIGKTNLLAEGNLIPGGGLPPGRAFFARPLILLGLSRDVDEGIIAGLDAELRGASRIVLQRRPELHVLLDVDVAERAAAWLKAQGVQPL